MSTAVDAREQLAKWNPLDPEELANPYPTYALARREAPVFYNEYFDAWCVTRFDDVLVALKETKKLTAREAIGSGRVPDALKPIMPNGYPWDHPALVNNDPPAHTRVRRLANEAFRPNLIAAREPEITELVDELIDAFVADGRADLVGQLADRLPQLVICRLMGVADEHARPLAKWSEDKIAMLNPNLDDETLVELARGQAAFYKFCDTFIEEQRRNPSGDTLMSRLILARSQEDEGEPALTQRELISILAQLLLGGNSTTRRLLSTLLLRLLEHPDQLKAVCTDPSLADAAVEEALRHSTSVKGLFRDALAEFEVGGTTIPSGARVVIFWASANHDETKFERPDEFDIFRPDADKNIAFSRFAHFCIGASLARLEARVALQRLTARLPNLRRADEGPLEWEPLALHMGLGRLEVVWDGP
jgi:cytochrome P450